MPYGSEHRKGDLFYIAGRMTGMPDFNYPYFQKAMEQLQARGLNILSPHQLELEGIPNEHHHLIEPELLWQTMMGGAFVMLVRCNHIILLKGWSESRGARQELLNALTSGYGVWYYDPDEDSLLEMK